MCQQCIPDMSGHVWNSKYPLVVEMRLTPISPLHLCKQAATSDKGDTQGQSVLPPCRAILPAYGAGPYLPAIVMERPVYVREISDGLYTAFTYLLYKVQLNENYWNTVEKFGYGVG